MKNRYNLAACGCCLLMAFLMTMVWLQQKEESLAAQVAPQVIRFHVLANSDSPQDQMLKVQVKEMLLQYIYEDLGSQADRDQTVQYLTDNKTQLEQAAQAYMKLLGYDYTASVELKESYFPTKTYGDVVFPCGLYETATITLGKGGGQNWWCVLYPPLCFVDNSYGVVPDSSKEKLAAVLPEQDYTDLMAHRRLVFQKPSSDYQSQEIDLYPPPSDKQPESRVAFKLYFLELIASH